MAVATLGAWLTVRAGRRAPCQEFGQGTGLPALGQFGSIDIGDDRAAEIIEQFAPALAAAAQGRSVES
jgi:hypothetical protein